MATSEQRVSIRVSQGGHDVPANELGERFPRTLANLVAAIRALPHVLVYDNSDLAAPFRHVATFEGGRPKDAVPVWLGELLGASGPSPDAVPSA